MIQETSGLSPACSGEQRELYGLSVQDQVNFNNNLMEFFGYQQVPYQQQLTNQQQMLQYQQQQAVVFDFEDYDASNTEQSNQSNQSSNQTLQSTQDVAMASDTSTVEDTNNDISIKVSEPYSYLQGLNSANLMQFSQQSAMEELMLKEQLDREIKPNLDVLPTFEEHDIGGYKFKLNLNTQRKGKSSWIYSETLNKIYIRMNEIFSIDAVYTPKMPLQQLRIRALMSFVKEVSEPVLRCQNHISKDNESEPQLRHSLLRCENPAAEHCGSAQGKNINDRYSVLLPLGLRVTPNDDNTISQTIALKFTCQNSCIGRKETSIIFLLEGMNGEILSQRVIDVKICSCPKRDKAMDERNLSGNKRKISEDLHPRAEKIMRQDSPAPTNIVKEEYNYSDGEDNAKSDNFKKPYDIQRIPASGGYRFYAELENKEEVNAIVDLMVMRAAVKCLNQGRGQISRYYRRLKRLSDRAKKL